MHSLHSGLKDFDKAFYHLNKTYEQNRDCMPQKTLYIKFQWLMNETIPGLRSFYYQDGKLITDPNSPSLYIIIKPVTNAQVNRNLKERKRNGL